MRYYHRHLPHYHIQDAALFITMRLANSLPASAVLRLRDEDKLLHTAHSGDDAERRDFLEKYFDHYDQLLHDHASGYTFLADEQIAEEVRESLHFRDGKEFDLYAYCIMPNHIHLLIRILDKTKSVDDILQSMKAYTAMRANKLLHRTGMFWQHESYDHVIRNEEEFQRVVEYIMNNPVKAGLVETAEQWKWSYYKAD